MQGAEAKEEAGVIITAMLVKKGLFLKTVEVKCAFQLTSSPINIWQAVRHCLVVNISRKVL